MQFAERLLGIMESRSITAYKLSKDTGVTDSLIGYWVRGMRLPAMGNLILLADYFDISIDYLVGRTDNPEVNRKEYHQ